MSRPDIPVTISGDPKGLADALARVRALGKTTANDVAASFAAIKSKVGGAGGFITGIVTTGAVAAIKDAANAIAAVGDEARRAGVSVQAFQELKFVAEQNRVAVDALTDGIKELNLRADEFIVTGGGAAAEAFQRLGYSADKLKDKLKDPSALFTEIIGKLQQFDKAAQIRILDEVFGGTGGEQFLQLIRQGEKGIRDQIRAAHDLGLVMDEELIKRAEEIDRKFNTIAATVGTNLKKAIVDAAGAFMSFSDSFRAFEQQQTGSLLYRQSMLKDARDRASKQAGTTEDKFLSIFGRDSATEIAAIDAEMKQIQGLLDRRAGIIDAAAQASPKGGRIQSAQDILRAEFAQQRVNDAFESGSSGSGKGGGGGRSKVATDAEKEAKAIDQVIASLREELAVIGLTDIERERTLALREAGVTATSKEGQQISDLIDQKYRQLAAEDALIDQQERLRDGAEQMGAAMDDQLNRVIDGTFDAKEAIAALLTEIINVKTNGQGLFGSIFSALSGGFGGGNSDLFSSSFVPNTTLGGILGYGGARAGGGDVSPGRIYRFNEYEDEFMVPTNHGRIIAPSKLQGAGSGEAADGGRSIVQIELSEDLVAKILQQASGQTVQLMKRNEAARANVRQNGGDY
ncbi:tail tape measure protein [Ensifer adhaerens]|uniref:Tail tape measure protein n=1 Tax=Ensifer adhaerens TaxID=106592 RepID=A0A0L8BT52_ENSAD|nr:tail tape measure protein [Ensifer adhaerens]KOF17887.1 tail tape measure protein [Ensifer adhaerens]